jgi:hypothetical protein
MLQKRDARFLFLAGISFLILITGPYLWAYLTTGSDHFFGGFLFNPIDGNSYLAKMYQGWLGSWRFTLPYSPHSGEGAYLFLFYLALGHLSRITGYSLHFVFHMMRLLGALILLIVLWNFYSQVSPTRIASRMAFLFALFGSGLGWFVSFFGILSADLWVAEGFPFLSAYANPHFPLGMSILIMVLTPRRESGQDRNSIFDKKFGLILVIMGLLLAILLPFGIVLAVVILAVMSIWESWERVNPKNKLPQDKQIGFLQLIYSTVNFRKLILLCVGGIPVLLYQFWVTQSDPMLAIWSAQNLTISPPIWDLLISFAPVLLFGIPGAWFVWRKGGFAQRILIVWIIVGILLIYIPWGLQRRFLLGYMVPFAGLAGLGLDHLFSHQKRITIAMLSVVIMMALPTNLLILVGGIGAIQSHEPMFYLSKDEKISLDWLESNSPDDALVLASPQMGLFIPAYTGRRVLYGHPFETVNADVMEAKVEHFFQGMIKDNEISTLSDVDYLFYGPREREYGGHLPGAGMKVVFQFGNTEIYEIDGSYSNTVK